MGYRRWLTDRDHQIPSFSTSCDEKTLIFYREITDCVQTRRCRMFGWIYVWHGRLCRCILRELQERKSRFEALTNFSNGRGVEEACTETGVPSSCLSLSFSTIIYPPLSRRLTGKRWCGRDLITDTFYPFSAFQSKSSQAHYVWLHLGWRKETPCNTLPI